MQDGEPGSFEEPGLFTSMVPCASHCTLSTAVEAATSGLQCQAICPSLPLSPPASMASSTVLQTDEIRKQGWVYKESAMLRQYRKRWLVLTPERLYTFKKERVYDAPTEEVDLRQCGTVKSADDMTNRPFSFTVQVPDRNFFLVAMSDADRNEWVAAIGRATTESRRVRSYSEEVEYQEQQARLTAANRDKPPPAAAEPDDAVPQRRATAFT